MIFLKQEKDSKFTREVAWEWTEDDGELHTDRASALDFDSAKGQIPNF